jgi:hypothetical protein
MRLARWSCAVLLIVAPTLSANTALADSNVTAENSSSDTETESGSASGSNSSNAFVGQSSGGNTTVGADGASAENAGNIQDGDNEFNLTQTTTVKTGSGVTGQVIGGVVQDGNLTINATNTSEDVEVETGEATGTNDVAAFVGLAVASSTEVGPDEVDAIVAQNIQDGDNEANIDQTVESVSGEGVAGQIIGAAVQGGTTDITAENRSEDADVETGAADGTNTLAAFVGLNASTDTLTVGGDDASVGDGVNVQDGDNIFDADQTARAMTGDGVAGQIFAVSSGGDTTIDGKNVSRKVDVETGEADATNDGAAFVGLASSTSTTVSSADADAGTAANVQDGDNEASLEQLAEAMSGDAVAGQVAAVTTSAGSADIVLSNESFRTDVVSGESDETNEDSLFAGLNVSTTTLIV